MHQLRSAILGSGLAVPISLLSLLIIPLLFIAEPSWEPQLWSSQQLVTRLVSDGSAQEDMERNPSVAEGVIVFMEYTITIPEANLTIPDNLTLFEQGHQDL